MQFFKKQGLVLGEAKVDTLVIELLNTVEKSWTYLQTQLLEPAIKVAQN